MSSQGSKTLSTLRPTLSDKQIERLLDRTNFVEGGFRNMRNSIMKYALKHASTPLNLHINSLRNKGDHIAGTLADLAESGGYNTTTKPVLAAAADALFVVGDCRASHVNNLKARILPLLFSYDNLCKKMRAKLVLARKSHERAELKRKYYLKLEEKSCNIDVLNQAEKAWQQSVTKASQAETESEEATVEFEYKRVEDTRQALEGFFTSEMALHAKALEIYTEAYQQIKHMNAEADVQVLKSCMTLRGIQPLVGYKSKNDFGKTPSVINYFSKDTSPTLDRHNEQHSGRQDEYEKLFEEPPPSFSKSQPNCDPACLQAHRSSRVGSRRKKNKEGVKTGKSCCIIRAVKRCESGISIDEVQGTESTKCNSSDTPPSLQRNPGPKKLRQGEISTTETSKSSKKVAILSQGSRKNSKASHVVSKYKYPEKQ